MTKQSQLHRIETYGLKSRGKKANFQGVVSEGLRSTKSSCKHVEEPQEPLILRGRWPQHLPKALDASKKVFEKKHKLKIRDDAQLAAGYVASYPATVKRLKKDPLEYQAYLAWRENVLADLDQLAVDNPQARLGCALEHLDEKWPHVHAWWLATEYQGKFELGMIHPGRVADAENTGADRIPAYKAAMKKWQDERWFAVGSKVGLSRLSPHPVPRLTKPQWVIENKVKARVEEELAKIKQQQETNHENAQRHLRAAQNRPV